MSVVRESARRASCMNNLKQIARALSNYESQYDRLPPAYVADAAGRPMHSWRVLILPFLDENALYTQYRFDEPWDGPNNRKLAAQMPPVYRCPSEPWDSGAPSERTNYVAVVGPSTVWPGPRGRPLAEIRDKLASTILLVELAESDIHWMEPRDLTVAEALGAEPDACRVPSSRHWVEGDYFIRSVPAAGHLATVNGSSQLMPGRLTRDEMAALLSVDGGEPVALGDIVGRQFADMAWGRLNWSHCIGLPLYIISLLALLCRPLPEKWRIRPAKQP